MKKVSKNVLLILFGAIISFAMNVAAEAVISSRAVSYSNAATSETTVSGALDELFSAVDINEKIGNMANISSIGDGTITGAISTLNSSKQAKVTGGATTIATSNLTASRALVSNGSGKVAVSAVTSTELGYLDGVTSNVQTQLNAIINPPNVASISVLSTSLIKSTDTSYTASKAGYYKFLALSTGTTSSDVANIVIYNASGTVISANSAAAILYAHTETEWIYLKANQQIKYYVSGDSRRLYYAPEL